MTAVATDYLGQFDAAADPEKFPLVRRWIDTEPLPFFKTLLERRPILVTPVCTLLARFDDVTEVLNMPRIFTAALYLPKMGNGIYLMAHDDDALHTREKSIMQGMLNRDDLPQGRWHPNSRGTSTGLSTSDQIRTRSHTPLKPHRNGVIPHRELARDRRPGGWALPVRRQRNPPGICVARIRCGETRRGCAFSRAGGSCRRPGDRPS